MTCRIIDLNSLVIKVLKCRTERSAQLRAGINGAEKPVTENIALFTHSRKLRCYYKRSLGESPQPGNPIVHSPFKCISCANFQPQSQVTSWNKLCYLQWNIFAVIHFPHGRSQTGALTDLEELQSHFGFTASSYCTNTDLFSTCWASLTPVFLGFPGGSDRKESACNMGDLAPIPGLGRSPVGGDGNPFQYSCVESTVFLPWTEEHGGLQSMRLTRVGHD